MAKFLNLDESGADDIAKIGQKLKARKPASAPKKVQSEVVEKVATEQGYERPVTPRKKPEPKKPKLGRPPVGEDMTYWKIYLSSEMRDWMETTRAAKKYRRLNDLLEDMRTAFEESQGARAKKTSRARRS